MQDGEGAKIVARQGSSKVEKQFSLGQEDDQLGRPRLQDIHIHLVSNQRGFYKHTTSSKYGTESQSH